MHMVPRKWGVGKKVCFSKWLGKKMKQVFFVVVFTCFSMVVSGMPWDGQQRADKNNRMVISNDRESATSTKKSSVKLVINEKIKKYMENHSELRPCEVKILFECKDPNDPRGDSSMEATQPIGDPRGVVHAIWADSGVDLSDVKIIAVAVPEKGILSFL